MWSTDTFYEFAVTVEDKLNERTAKQYIQSFVLAAPDEETTLDERDHLHVKLLEETAQAIEASAARVERVMRFVEKRLRKEPDILSLLWDVDEETSRDWSDFTGYGYLCVMQEFYLELRDLILDLLDPGQSPDRLATVMCDGGDDDGPELQVLLVDEDKDSEFGNPVRGIPDEFENLEESSTPEQAEETNDEDAVVEEILALARGEAVKGRTRLTMPEKAL